jgi:transglutaminase-like putative cysteine protease
VLHEQITVAPLGTSSIFIVGGLLSFWPEQHTESYQYSFRDRVLQREVASPKQARYSVEATDSVPAQPGARLVGPSEIDPRIAELARQPQVSGSDDQGSLAEQRLSMAPSTTSTPATPLDIEIARNIEKYLRTNFTYTLDLTTFPGKDPIVAFLYDTKQGHCEFFAGAMALMCQSLGLQARVVVVFKSDEFNPMFNYCTIRQSHAHAWVEVLDDKGIWQTFDPTTSNEAAPSVRADGWWQQIGHRVRSDDPRQYHSGNRASGQ